MNGIRLNLIRFIAFSFLFAVSCSTAISETAGESTTNAQPDQSTSFRVTIHVFEGNQTRPLAQHLIRFQDGVIYDFDETQGVLVTVIDPVRERIVLLDRESQTKAQLSTKQLNSLIAHLQASAETDKDKRRMGIVSDTQFNQESKTHVVAFQGIRYSATTQNPESSRISSQFHQFADWATKLNTSRNRGLPPFGRLKLNEKISASGKIPDEVIVQLEHGTKKREFRSTHALVEKLSATDEKQIDEVKGMLALYKAVPLSSMP